MCDSCANWGCFRDTDTRIHTEERERESSICSSSKRDTYVAVVKGHMCSSWPRELAPQLRCCLDTVRVKKEDVRVKTRMY